MDLTKAIDRQSRRKPSLDLGTMVFGKVPPQAKELEEAVLGAIMIEKQAFEIAGDILTPECFYSEANQRIFKAMQDLSNKRHPIDLLTLVEEMKVNEDLELIGGPYTLSKLTNNIVSAANIEAHCRIVLQKHLMRELIRVSGEVITQAYEDSSDVFEVMEYAEEKMSGLRLNNIKKSFRSLQNIINENLVSIEELRSKGEDITGVPSGFDDLDKITCGWQATDLIILAARPSVGKTAFALTLAKNAAKSFLEDYLQDKSKKQKSVGFFSLEMKDRALVNRMLSSESGVWMWRLKNGRMDDGQMKTLYEGAERLNKIQIFIDDTGALKLSEFKAKARMMVRKHNVGIIFFDYLQLAKDPEKKMREQEISSISGTLKQMAKELDIPIVALSQLNREFGKAGTGAREPQLSDLRESGAIEQDADMVMFLYKPSEGEVADDKALIDNYYMKIDKFRNGVSPVKFIGKFKGETQTHEWLKVVDEKTFQPAGENWKPVKTPIDYTQPKINYEDEAPF